jgi:hypothetical protein
MSPKGAEHVEDEITPVRDPPSYGPLEKAAEFLADHDGETSFTYEEEQAVLRRIDLRVLPLLLGAYFFQQLDKSTLRCVNYFTTQTKDGF